MSTDLSEIPWRRGRGYDAEALTNVLTADHAWAHRVIDQVRQKVTDVRKMRALGFCVSIQHARFMAERFRRAGLAAVAIWGDTAWGERQGALRDLAAGRVQVVFTVDLFNEGVDVPTVDTLLLLRPTESPTLFLQQLGRGLRKADDKPLCTVLDFVGHHRKEFRYDLRFRALLGGSRIEVEHQVEQGFPFLPAGCSLQLDPVAQDVVLRSIRNAVPSDWREKCKELRSLGDVSLRTYLQQTGLELEDVYASNHSWTEMRRAVGLPTQPAGRDEVTLLRAVGRLLHVDDDDRIAAYRSFAVDLPQAVDGVPQRDARLLRMLVSSISSVGKSASIQAAVAQLDAHPQVLAELVELLDVLSHRVDHLHPTLRLDPAVPLRAHARYTRQEILAAFGVGDYAQIPTWREGVRYVEPAKADLFVFTLDKTGDQGFSPTTRYQDYAISRSLIHWESQSTTSVDSPTGQRYINHEALGSSIVLFARLRTSDRAFRCLGTARYQSHENERPIAFTWQLDEPLPPDVYTAFAAAVA